MGAKKYEDLDVWKMAFALTRDIYSISKSGPLERDFGLKDQFRRASVSIMANVAEGFARKSNRDFARFLDIARASAMEVQSLLHLARAEGYVSKADFRRLYDQCNHLRFATTSLMTYLSGHDHQTA